MVGDRSVAPVNLESARGMVCKMSRRCAMGIAATKRDAVCTNVSKFCRSSELYMATVKQLLLNSKPEICPKPNCIRMNEDGQIF